MESPSDPTDIPGLCEISRSLDIPIANGEWTRTKYEMREIFEKRAYDISMPDIARTGLTGGKQIVCENWRNLISVGAKPLAITNCLNFGNPEDAKIMGEFAECLIGIKESCEFLDYPVVSGNVYEGKAKIIFATSDKNTVIQHFKDDATAFNNQKKANINGKGILNNRISEHLLKSLSEIGIKNHLIRRLNRRYSR